ncbi:hypothetical protein NQ315_017437 [Exocentrus adspersus]|uniref:PiggyBac transposable element-derived protein domain-containing protein n=1 Tax=Exocentrus adspersus TaxID=1586481 RepID=A0AAV8VKN5_9CUCU|nr:hypothetical protein NQ315_017437 [Exocentrus adspersus]
MSECLDEGETVELGFDDESDHSEIDNVEEELIDSDSEQDISDSEDGEENYEFLQGTFIGKNQTTVWSKHPIPRHGRTRIENLIKQLPGRERDAKNTDLVEIKAWIGLLYLTGVLKSSRLNLEDLWCKNGTGVEVFRLTMSQQRFRFLLQHVRFDDSTTRDERRQSDKLAPIREVFENFIANCKTAYTPFQNVTIDEKLEAFRGNCNFRQYIPSKPAKYGVKIFALVDSKTFYTLNMEVYVGKQPEGPFAVSNSPKDVVARLCQPIKGTGRNVTVDYWFTSLELLENLKKNFNLTLLGTIRKNKKELPQEFANPSTRPPFSSMFAFQKHVTLVSYIPKKGKNVLLVSGIHYDDEIDKKTNKPEIIMEYNRTKGGVDSVDKCVQLMMFREILDAGQWSFFIP